MLGFTQQAVADRIGLPLSRVKIYENARAPLRFDLALRLCRHLIISEEWLATGAHVAQIEALEKRKLLTMISMDEMLKPPFLPRQCLDLAVEEVYRDILPGTHFSSAYEGVLSSAYARLVRVNPFSPRIVFRDSDSHELFKECFSVILARHLRLLEVGVDGGRSSQGVYVRKYFSHLKIVDAKILNYWLRAVTHRTPTKRNFPFIPSGEDDPASPTDQV